MSSNLNDIIMAYELEKNSPHVYIIVPTRLVEADGFCKKKDREYDNKKYINI